MVSKKILVIAFMLLFPVFSWSQEISKATQMFRSNIEVFLKEEGFAPSIDKEGSILFKKEGTRYWIDITDDKPFYVVFYTEGLSTKDANQDLVHKAINETNMNIRAIKCSYKGDYVSLVIESYYHDAESFKYVFYTYLNILELASEAVKDEYSKYDTSSSYKSTSQSHNSLESKGSVTSRTGNTLYLSCPIRETEYHKWWIFTIDLNPSNTILQERVVPKSDNTFVFSDMTEYIEDCDTGKRYPIQSSSLGTRSNPTILHGKSAHSFSSTFPALPNSVKRINIWSGSDYYVKNMKIR